MNLLIDFIDELELRLDFVLVSKRFLQLIIYLQAFANNGDGRSQDVVQQARIEPGGFAGVARKDHDEKAQWSAFVAVHRQHQQGPARLQRAAHELGLASLANQDIGR